MQEILTTALRETVEQHILNALNEQAAHIVTTLSMHSPRAVGDAVQEFLAQNIECCFPNNVIKKFESGFERRSMEDMAFYDVADNYHAVDVKTQNVATTFNMPNLISVQRIAKFYQNATNCFNLLMVRYEQVGDDLHYTDCHFLPIEHLAWDCLTIGALGWGRYRLLTRTIF